MPTYFSRSNQNLVLNASQRTALLNLLQQLVPGIQAATIKDVAFFRIAGGGIGAHVTERVQANSLTDIPAGVSIEQE